MGLHRSITGVIMGDTRSLDYGSNGIRLHLHLKKEPSKRFSLSQQTCVDPYILNSLKGGIERSI